MGVADGNVLLAEDGDVLELRDDGWHAQPTGDQDSHVLTSMLGADALAIVPIEGAAPVAGERIEIELLPGIGPLA